MNVTSPCEFHCSCCWVCLHKRKEKKTRKHLHKVNQDTATRGAWFLQMWERFLHKEAIGENAVYSEASAFLTLAEFPYSVLLPCLNKALIQDCFTCFSLFRRSMLRQTSGLSDASNTNQWCQRYKRTGFYSWNWICWNDPILITSAWLGKGWFENQSLTQEESQLSIGKL